MSVIKRLGPYYHTMEPCPGADTGSEADILNGRGRLWAPTAMLYTCRQHTGFFLPRHKQGWLCIAGPSIQRSLQSPLSPEHNPSTVRINTTSRPLPLKSFDFIRANSWSNAPRHRVLCLPSCPLQVTQGQPSCCCSVINRGTFFKASRWASQVSKWLWNGNLALWWGRIYIAKKQQ